MTPTSKGRSGAEQTPSSALSPNRRLCREHPKGCPCDNIAGDCCAACHAPVLSAAEAVALPMPLHHVHWPKGERPTFTCDAEIGAKCRIVCAVDCGAEVWPCGTYDDDYEEQPGHPMRDSGECHVLLFLDNSDHDQDRYSGPIKVWWECDYYEWEPAVTGGSDTIPPEATDENAQSEGSS